MRGESVLVKQGSLLSSDHVPLGKFSPWFTRGKAPAVCKGHPAHAKSLALGKAWIRTSPPESAGSDALEHNLEILMLDTLSESQESGVIVSSGNFLHSNLHAIVNPCTSKHVRVQDFKFLLSVTDVKNT